MRTENLKFRTDLKGLSYGWLVSDTVDDYFEWKIAQKSLNKKPKFV